MSLTFYLHGMGSDAASFAAAWGDRAGAGAVFLDGPERDVATGRRRWFPFTARPEALARHLVQAAVAVEARILVEISARGLSPESTVRLAGHSQGAMLALEVLRAGRLRVDAVTALAGFLPAGLLALGPAARPVPARVTLRSTTKDAFVAPADVTETARVLATWPDVVVDHAVTDAVDHGFDAAWLTAAFAGARA